MSSVRPLNPNFYRSFVADIQGKLVHLQNAQNNQQNQPTSYQQAGQATMSELKDQLTALRKDTGAILARPQVRNIPRLLLFGERHQSFSPMKYKLRIVFLPSF